MKKKILVVKIIRILFAMLIFLWGIMLWKELPEQIPLHFDASLKPDEVGEKKKFIWLFLYAIAAFLPIPAMQISDGEPELECKRSLIMSYVHTILMCTIFVVMMLLIKKNL